MIYANIFLIDPSKSIKQRHLEKNHPQLNSKGIMTLSETFATGKYGFL